MISQECLPDVQRGLSARTIRQRVDGVAKLLALKRSLRAGRPRSHGKINSFPQ